ncbi:hypothetical protein ASPZODRAFT_126658 [Penicilliopsis zonata CBS 506.65]|uniref:FAD-binding domain-containing protein n=1 Tax=Penicilliopsis zonata CBS 506.65 TaxID=1073090 RepID=A0A1L9SUD5_9EURO|nr:hypothetical protein ASPZODRAFT_126658 [Penicilliopsis zonata CBS 506.65]OJJ50734.1 hypothetical protein ASPZODRAFT_126658 [Penicilliopsis zonata CBS 506.65]
MSHVLIIGGGLGGLCLAQALKKHGIPFKLFEKDERKDFRAQGYRLRVSDEGVDALEYALPPELYELFKDTCAGKQTFGVRLDADGADLSNQQSGGPPPLKGDKSYVVDRTTFREVLLRGLEDSVFFGKALDRYILHEDHVTAYFTDGSAIDGGLIVGADGVHSRVRRQLVPGFRAIDTGLRIIYGKTPLTLDFEASFPEEYRRGVSLVQEKIQRENDDGSFQHTLFYEPIRFPCANTVADPRLPAPYIYWVLCSTAMPLPDEELLHLTHDESAQLSLRLTQHWTPVLRVLLEMQDVSQTSTLRVASAPPDLPAWEVSRRVTLLGDAIHPMPPTGAMGVVTALRDVEDLARRIVAAGGVAAMEEARIAEYEESLRQFARNAIALSWRGGNRGFGLKKVEERLDCLIDM